MRLTRLSQSKWVILFSLVILAIFLRAAAMRFVGATQLPPGEDISIARHLAEGRGFSLGQYGYFGPTSLRPPVYPMLQAGARMLLGHENTLIPRLMLALNTLAGGFSVLAGFLLAKQIFQSESAGLWLGFFLAILPTQLYASTFQQGLSLAVFLLLLTIWTILKKDIRLAIPTGILVGMTVLTESVLLVPLSILILWTGRRHIRQMILTLLAGMCVIFPWVYRNTVVHQHGTGITNQFWFDVFTGNGPNATGSPHLYKNFSPIAHLSPRQTDQLKSMPEPLRMQQFRTWALEWIQHHPLSYLRLCSQRLLKTTWLDWDHPTGLQPLNLVSRSLCFVGWLGALILMTKQRRWESVTICVSLGLILATVFTLAEARNSVFMDVSQLLGILWLKYRGSY